MTRAVATFLLMGIGILGAACASVETGPPPDVSGRWTGQCYNCPVREFTLVVAQDGGALSGTLQAAGRTGLGQREMPLRNGKVAGRRVTFETMGADGVAFVADLTVSGDGKTMDGHARHLAGFPVSFRRAQP